MDHKVYGERMEETLKGQLQEKDKELKALAEAKQNIEGEYDKRLATLTQADELKKKKLQEEKLKSLEVVDNTKKSTERLQRQLEDSKREAENMRHSLRMMIGSFTINTQTARKEVKAPVNPKDRAMRLNEKWVNKRAHNFARQVINNTIDLSKQTASVMTTQAVQQSLPRVFETVDAEMTDVPPKPVKEGSTFHWDFHTHQWLENTKANQALGASLDAHFKEQRRQKRLRTRTLGIPAGVSIDDLVSSDEEEQKTPHTSSAPTDVHVIEGEVEDRPGYTYDRFLGRWLEITPAEQALQQQEEAKKEAFIKKRALELKKKRVSARKSLRDSNATLIQDSEDEKEGETRLRSKNFKNPGTALSVATRVSRWGRHSNMSEQQALRRAPIVDQAKRQNTYDGKSVALKNLALMDLYKQRGLLYA